MNFDFFLKVNQFRVSFGQYASAEDFIDVLNYLVTPAILIFFAGISASKQYLFTPIQCWSIIETASTQRMEYVENLCWIENMYYWPQTATLPKNTQVERRERKMWRNHEAAPHPTYLIDICGEFQAKKTQFSQRPETFHAETTVPSACFYLPRICWLFLSNRFGTSIMDIIRFAMSSATVDQDKRQRMVQYLAAHIEKVLFYAQPYRRGRWNQLKSRCAHIFPCIVLTKRTGFVLVGSYLLIKLLYVKNSALQLVIMQEFLGMNHTLWGLQLLVNMLTRREWEQTGIFPRVARCDVLVDNVGQSNLYTMQCVLPNNMLNEKMYLFLWLWTWAVLLFTACSFLSWAISSTMRSSRRTFIKKYLKIMTPIHADEKMLAKRFVNNFLRYDGVFILKMIRYNAGD
uniref:Innexin n=1 Tax=Macrostomum lignano TaxID=282301 RepID=A0A1I8IW37_9PLAT